MPDDSKKDKWLYVAVEDPGGNEKFVGLYDKQADISYIPAFESKEDALTALVNLPRQEGKKYEVQAVLADILCEDARKNGFLVFLTDGDGKMRGQIEA